MNANALAIKAAYDATAQGDVATLIGLLADDVQWRATGPGPLAGLYEASRTSAAFSAKWARSATLSD